MGRRKTKFVMMGVILVNLLAVGTTATAHQHDFLTRSEMIESIGWDFSAAEISVEKLTPNLFVLFGLAINLSSYLIGFIGAIIITREIWVGALRDLNARNGIIDATKVTFLAKIKTTVQLFTLSTYLFGLAINNMLIIVIADILLFISLIITLYTGLIYTLNTFKKSA